MAGVKSTTGDQIAKNAGGNLKPCSDCGKSQFTMFDTLAFVGQIHLGPPNRIEADKGQAFVTVSCDSCGLTKLYNAKSLGY